jgi:imidazoleglycerol-phosphate dehydratase
MPQHTRVVSAVARARADGDGLMATGHQRCYNAGMSELILPRTATVDRKTLETQVLARVTLDGAGQAEIATGLGFLDHMLDQLARHSLIDITLKVTGDLHVDGHHTTEDSAIALGQAVSAALGERRGIRRFGEALSAMDETLSRIVVDISGRPFLVWRVTFTQPRLGDLDTELIGHWFGSFAQHAGLTLHVETLYGANSHHIAESCFKGLARALRQAVERDPRKADAVPSTKGVLGGSL